MRAAGQGADPGLVFWSGANGLCRAAITLTPEHPVGTETVLNLGLLAAYEALAVLAAPETPIHIRTPDQIIVDGARVATLSARSSGGPGPAWAVLGVVIGIEPQHSDPGLFPDETCLVEEGFEPITAGALLALFCRHLLGWVDIWRHEGDGALHRALAPFMMVPA